MPEEVDLKLVRRLIDALESADAFERLDAIERLALLTQQRLDFAWRGPAEERAASVRRWRRWFSREEKRRRGRTLQATLQILAGGANVEEALEQAIEDLPPDAKKALIAQMIAKASAHGPASVGAEECQRCRKRPASVGVTSRRDDGTYDHVALCEVCAASAGG